MVTQITALPAAPSRADPANFSDRADAFVAALPGFVTQANQLATDVNGYANTAVNAPGTSATSTTSLAIGAGSKTLNIQTGKALVVGQWVIIASTASPANMMVGQITAYNSGTGSLTVNVSYITGTGTFAAWTVSLTLPQVALPLAGGTVTGATSFASSLSAATLTVAAGASVGGNLTVSANATVSGSLTSGAQTVNGNILLGSGSPTVQFNPGGPAVWAPAANTLALGTASTSIQRILIDAGGSVNVHGDAGSTGALPGSGSLRAVAGSANIAISTFNVGDYKAMQFARHLTTGDTEIGWITCTDTGVTYNSISDYRAKENVEPLTSAADRLMALKPCRFNLIAAPGRTVDGFLAHEAAEVVPESVTGEKDAEEQVGTATPPQVVMRYGTATSPTIERTLGIATPPEGSDAAPLNYALEDATPEGWTWAPVLTVDFTPPPIVGLPPEQTPEGWAWEETHSVDVTPPAMEGVPQSATPEGWTWAATGTRPIYQGFDPAKLVPLLTAALQEVIGRLDALESAR